MPEGHNIPSWFIPDDEQIIANEHEQEQIKEDGELDEPLCPHCGREYEREDDGWYIHRMRPVDGESFEWEAVYDALGRQIGRKGGVRVTPAEWCTPSGKRQTDNSQPWDYRDF
jgi:hypothetical protein